MAIVITGTQHLGRELWTSQPDTIKQNVEPLSDLLANFSAVSDAILSDGRYSWMLDEPS